jgi:hypothetical protein
MSTQEYIRSITELTPDDFPTLTPLPEPSNGNGGFFSNVSWQMWIILVLILALLGINIFAYLAKGTDETATFVNEVFGPVFKFLGYNTLTTTKQAVETSATGTKAGVDIVADTTIGAIDTVLEPSSTTGTSVGVSTPHIPNNVNPNPNTVNPNPNAVNPNVPKGYASLRKGGPPIVQANAAIKEQSVEQWQQDSLERALNDASQRYKNEPMPNDTIPTGKAGWCFIGEEHGIRSCSEIGVNDVCMSGDIFPTQAVCMNPNLRA